jgi:predicted protein tyrosine phosphatase
MNQEDKDYEKKVNILLDGPVEEDKIHIVIRSRRKAKDFTSDLPWAAIQIGDEEGDWPKLNKVKQVDVLQLAFPDREFIRNDEEVLFNVDHADKILDFFAEVAPKIGRLLVHCYAGVSRSPATGAALSKIHYGEDQRFFDNYCPNSMVYHQILERAVARGIWEPS